MRIRSVLVTAGICGSLVLPAAVASAAPPLRFSSPRVVTNTVPFVVSSIEPCPAPPASAAADVEIVEVALALPNGQGAVNVFVPNPDGSWSGTLLATFTSAPPKGDVTAVCAVIDNTTGIATAYATYKGDSVKLVS